MINETIAPSWVDFSLPDSWITYSSVMQQLCSLIELRWMEKGERWRKVNDAVRILRHKCAKLNWDDDECADDHDDEDRVSLYLLSFPVLVLLSYYCCCNQCIISLFADWYPLCHPLIRCSSLAGLHFWGWAEAKTIVTHRIRGVHEMR